MMDASAQIERRWLLARFARWIDDRLNPVMVKELRQAVSGRFVALGFVLFMGLSVLVLGLAIADAGDGATPTGYRVFAVIYGLLFVLCMLMMPALAGIRMAAERAGESVDLMFVTTLKAGRIVRGKFYAILVLTLVFFSACMPFLLLTYQLKGITLPLIVYLSGMGFMMICLAIGGGLVAGSLGRHRLFSGLLGLGTLAGIAYLGYQQIYLLYLISERGEYLGAFTQSAWDLLKRLAPVSGMLGGLLAVMLACATAALSPPMANRALPVRIRVTAVAIVSGALFFWGCLASPTGAAHQANLWLWMMFILLVPAMLASVSERELPGTRVAQQIPRGPLRRLVAFFFYSGAAGGILWCMAAFGVVLWFARCLADIARSSPPTAITIGGMIDLSWFDKHWNRFAAIAIYIAALGLTAAWLRRRGFLRRLATHWTWGIALIILFVFTLAPTVITFLAEGRFDTHSLDVFSALYFFSPVYVYIVQDPAEALTWWGMWLAIAFAVSGPWLWAQIQQFVPFRREITVAGEVPGPLVVEDVVAPD